MRRRGAVLAAALLSTALVLTACGDGDDEDDTGDATAETRSVTAENGTIEIPADPQRIVTIGNTTMPFIDLGGEPVGVTEASASELVSIPAEQKAAYEGAVNVGSEEIDLEKLASLEPDLILVQFHSSDWDEVGTQLESVAPTVYWGLDIEWKAFADAIAEAGNLTEGLNEQKAEFEEKVTGIQEEYGEIIDGTSFVDVSRGDWNDPGTFYIADIGCSEIARDDLGLDLPEAAEGEDPLAYTNLPFEQLSSLAEYDVITYPVDAEGHPTEPFQAVTQTSTWKALPAVTDGRALGVFCSGNNSYGPVLQYLDSLDSALASLQAKE
ncbi:ABC transporter substrate-binding protein [Jiangella anatolica]|uniref:ABC transporter substrate-binding protein n=1 Tax=Jiangella anatolica TaxID=2670374 RepID=A0A2W2CD65_9ACTN|nr:ABC transporter substrate-binding protein [Jiangella anatolica]